MSNHSSNSTGFFQTLVQLSPDNPYKTVIIAVMLCLVCSTLVATSAILLQPVQTANAINDKRKNILQVAGIFDPTQSIDQQFKAIDAKVIEISSGAFAQNIDAQNFDMFSEQDNTFTLLADDPAGIVSIPKYASIYFVRSEDDEIESIILPVYGYGLWSTMYGFIAMETDLNQVKGLKFYDQAETPGLGAEVDNPRWRAQWEKKFIFDDEGNIRVHVSKNASNSADADYGVDAISGASMTSRGVENLLRFWFGEQGFKNFIQNYKETSLS